jgi:hypothetical protein
MGTKGSPARSSSAASPAWTPPSCALIAVTKSPGSTKLGGIRQWIESINDTLKGQLSLEQHGGHIPAGVWARICQRVIALAAGVWHNWTLWEHGLIDAPAATSSTTDH